MDGAVQDVTGDERAKSDEDCRGIHVNCSCTT